MKQSVVSRDVGCPSESGQISLFQNIDYLSKSIVCGTPKSERLADEVVFCLVCGRVFLGGLTLVSAKSSDTLPAAARHWFITNASLDQPMNCGISCLNPRWDFSVSIALIGDVRN